MQSFLDLFNGWYLRWIGTGVEQHIVNLIGGFIGAVIFCAWTMPVIRLPEYDSREHTLRLNSVGIVVVGVFIAFLVDTHFVLSLISGFLGPKISEVTVNRVLPGLGGAIVRYAETRATESGGSTRYGVSGYDNAGYSGGYGQSDSGYGSYGGVQSGYDSMGVGAGASNVESVSEESINEESSSIQNVWQEAEPDDTVTSEQDLNKTNDKTNDKTNGGES